MVCHMPYFIVRNQKLTAVIRISHRGIIFFFSLFWGLCLALGAFALRWLNHRITHFVPHWGISLPSSAVGGESIGTHYTCIMKEQAQLLTRVVVALQNTKNGSQLGCIIRKIACYANASYSKNLRVAFSKTVVIQPGAYSPQLRAKRSQFKEGIYIGNRLFYFQTNPINTKHWKKKVRSKVNVPQCLVRAYNS